MATPYDYGKLATTVTSLVQQFGMQGCSVKRPNPLIADIDKPWKGEAGPDQVVVASCAVLLGGISRYRMGGPSEVLGKGESPEPSENSTAFMAAADGAAAKPGDYIETPDGDRLAIEKITPLKPGGVNLLWQLALGT